MLSLEQPMCIIAIMIKMCKLCFILFRCLFLSTYLQRKKITVVEWYWCAPMFMYMCWERTIRAYIMNVTYFSMHENLNSVNSHRRPKQISCGSMNSIEITHEYGTIQNAMHPNVLKSMRLSLLLLLFLSSMVAHLCCYFG